MLVEELVINGKVFLPGDQLICTNLKAWEKNNPFHKGTKALIRHIDKMGPHTTIAVESMIGGLDGWHDLDGEVDDNVGYFMKLVQLDSFWQNTVTREVRGVVTDNYEHKGIDIKDFEFRLIQVDEESKLVLVEFDKYVNGFSGDSMGRKGHCLLLPTEITKRLVGADKKGERVVKKKKK